MAPGAMSLSIRPARRNAGSARKPSAEVGSFEQRRNIPAQRFVIRAGCGEKCRTLAGRARAGRVIQFLDPLPLFRGHVRLVTCRSHFRCFRLVLVQ